MFYLSDNTIPGTFGVINRKTLFEKNKMIELEVILLCVFNDFNNLQKF